MLYHANSMTLMTTAAVSLTQTKFFRHPHIHHGFISFFPYRLLDESSACGIVSAMYLEQFFMPDLSTRPKVNSNTVCGGLHANYNNMTVWHYVNDLWLSLASVVVSKITLFSKSNVIKYITYKYLITMTTI